VVFLDIELVLSIKEDVLELDDDDGAENGPTVFDTDPSKPSGLGNFNFNIYIYIYKLKI
jgi:hypothetical protein